MSPAFDVVGLGENSVDLVCRVPSFPQPEGSRSKLRMTGRTISCGGRVATAMAGCARLGLGAAYVGTVGDDENGDRLRVALARHAVNVDHLVVCDAPTRVAVLLVADDSGERAVLWERDERLRLQPAACPHALIARARLLHVDDEDPEMSMAAASEARRGGLMVTSDFDRATGLTAELVRSVTHPILAEGLLAVLTGTADPEQGLRRLRQETHAPQLTVTLGSRGAATLGDDDRFLFVPALRVRPVDTTAAGDLFRSGFIYGLLQGWSAERILRFANATAAAACLRRGAIDAAPALDEVERLLA